MFDRLSTTIINASLQSKTFDDHQPLFLTLARQIRLQHANVDEHMPVLVKEVEKLLFEIKTCMLTLEQQKIYSHFEDEFQQRKINGLLSYKWWILFCFRITILITPQEMRSNKTTEGKSIDPLVDHLLKYDLWLNHDSIVDLLNNENGCSFKHEYSYYAYILRGIIEKFPDVIMWPTTEGNISPHSFNQSLPYNVIPLGIVKKEIHADGQLFYPDRFFRHDLGHAENWFFSDNKYNSNTIQLFIEIILKKIEDTTDVRKKSQLDFMLFLMTHEYPLFFYRVHIKDIKNWLLKPIGNFTLYHACLNEHWYGLLIKPYLANKDSLEKETSEYLEETITLIDNEIKIFFDKYAIKDFGDQATRPRHYVVKEPLSEQEIQNHWTYNNKIAAHQLPIFFGEDYPSSAIFHYLVKKDAPGPEFKRIPSEEVVIAVHLTNYRDLFKKKLAKPAIHEEEFKRMIKKL